MGSASRESLAAAEQTLAATRGATLATGEQLLSAGRDIEGSPQLRALLADASIEASEKSALIARIFGHLDPAATKLLSALVESRWSSGAELLDGIEQIGIRVIARAAGPSAPIEAELFAVSRAVSSDADLELALGGSLGDPEQRVGVVDRLLARKVSPGTLAILRHLVQSPRGRRIGELLADASETVADTAGRAVATVTSATALSAAQHRRLAEALQTRYGRPVQLNSVIDPSVVGGLRVQLGGDVIDGTISARLTDLRLQLAG